MDGYGKRVEVQMVNFYRSLSEKDRRRYAAVEAGKLGHGGEEGGDLVDFVVTHGFLLAGRNPSSARH